MKYFIGILATAIGVAAGLLIYQKYLLPRITTSQTTTGSTTAAVQQQAMTIDQLV
jgi:hypothetical protein